MEDTTSRVTDAYRELKSLGYDVRETDEFYRKSHNTFFLYDMDALFVILPDGHTDEGKRGCGQHEIIDFNGQKDFGVYVDVIIILKEYGLYAEWINSGLVGVYDNMPHVTPDMYWSDKANKFVKTKGGQ